MPSPLAHYALGATVVHALGFRGRERALVALWAVAPDLDSLAAIPWMVLAPHLPLPADWLFLGQHVFDHRGLSHTFIGTLVAGLGVWLFTHDLRWTAAAGAAWLSHVLFDMISPWPVHPFWPFSDAVVNRPIVTTLDPVLTFAAIVATVGMALQIFARRERLLRWANAWLAPALVASLLAVPLSYFALVGASMASDVPLSRVYPAGFPSTVTIEPTLEGWTVQERPVPWEGAPSRTVPLVARGGNATTPTDHLPRVACTLERLGPFSPVTHAAWRWRATADEDHQELIAYDMVRNVTETGSPRVVFVMSGLEIRGAYLEAGPEAMRWLELDVPRRVLEDAAC